MKPKKTVKSSSIDFVFFLYMVYLDWEIPVLVRSLKSNSAELD